MNERPSVALIIETSSVYGRRLLAGVTRWMRTHTPWSVFLEQRGLTEKPPAWLDGWCGDGILSRVTTPELAEQLQSQRIATVDLTDIYGDQGLPRIWSNDADIGRLGAEHLLERGFRNFAYCGFTAHHWSQRRREGFLQTLQLPARRVAVYESIWGGPQAHDWQQERRQIADWLAQLPKPVGIMAANDLRGQQVLDACKQISVAVPEEAAIIGCDNDELLCQLCDPPLSSIVPNPEHIGFEAAGLLDRLIAANGKQRKAYQGTRLEIPPVGIVTRQSTDVLAIEDAKVAAALKFIRENACLGTSVEEVLKHIPISRSMLERGFRQYLQRSPHAEIRLVQLKRVRDLLSETDLPLDRIAGLAGFTHPEYMSVVFKRELGETPGQYRRRLTS
jgi:LacI family transcriptional regulator